MKTWALLKAAVGAAVLLLTFYFLTGCARPALETVQENPAPADEEVSAGGDAATAIMEDAPETPLLADGAVHPSAAHEIVVPADLKPSESVGEVIRLVNAGNDEELLMAFVTNSSASFKLTAADLIYLTDIGTPTSVLTAMLRHDHMLPTANVMLLPATEEAGPAVAEPVSELNNAPEPAAIQASPSFNAAVANFAPDVPPALPVAGPTVVLAEQPPSESPLPPDVVSGDAPPEFVEALAPYGTWVDVDGYGQCWQPTVAAVNSGWCPYAERGHWLFTDCGWYWASDYSWGWAPFHYGRWFQHASLGWCWVPGRVWASAWVCWRTSENYCGWAPLPPGARFSDGLRFHGLPVKPNFHFNLAAEQFHFVPIDHVQDRHPLLHSIPRERASALFHHSVASTTLVRNGNQIANSGVTAPRGVAATHRIHGGAPLAAPVSRIVAANPGSTSRVEPAYFAADSALITTYAAGAPASLIPDARPSGSTTFTASTTLGSSTARQAPATVSHHQPVHTSIPLSVAVVQAHPHTLEAPPAMPVPSHTITPVRQSTLVTIGANHALVVAGRHHDSPPAHPNPSQSANETAQVSWWTPTPSATRTQNGSHSHHTPDSAQSDWPASQPGPVSSDSGHPPALSTQSSHHSPTWNPGPAPSQIPSYGQPLARQEHEHAASPSHHQEPAPSHHETHSAPVEHAAPVAPPAAASSSSSHSSSSESHSSHR